MGVYKYNQFIDVDIKPLQALVRSSSSHLGIQASPSKPTKPARSGLFVSPPPPSSEGVWSSGHAAPHGVDGVAPFQ
jgi:hypothetical protein